MKYDYDKSISILLELNSRYFYDGVDDEIITNLSWLGGFEEPSKEFSDRIADIWFGVKMKDYDELLKCFDGRYGERLMKEFRQLKKKIDIERDFE